MRLPLLLAVFLPALVAQEPSFRWVNTLPESAPEQVRHGSFYSEANKAEVGYAIYLPPDYYATSKLDRRYPVVYYLHGGRPGGEHKYVLLASFFEPAMQDGRVPPMIYVFVNGGRLSHYDHEGSLGETAFVEELIPHIDSTYRTIARREARGLEGYSYGGRGAARIMFKHPELFISAASISGGHQHEKRISENDGVESEEVVIDPPWNNSWDLARHYAAREDVPGLHILVAVGTDDRNYEANLDWMDHLNSLGIDFEKLILDGVPHGAVRAYKEAVDDFMRFHAEAFQEALGEDW
ncbi:MAG: prolyl oligopeptidase family serine peptidase [bacterium]|nr:prolyl oligopeptidase family serine peptidase [bacterium]